MSKAEVDKTIPSTPTVDYNPLSKLAILAIACAGLFSGILVINTLTAFIQTTPPFLPTWLLPLPVAGAGLALLAQRQIKNSEGTLAGKKLATYALWLSVLAGLAYGAYELTTGFAVERQANNFLMEKAEDSGFFPYLLEGDIRRAFLLTKPVKQRLNVNPDDPSTMSRFEQPQGEKNPKGELQQFAESDYVQVILQAAREKKPIQPLGVKGWKYEKGEYYIERNYRVETSEIIADLVIPVKSNDTEVPGEGRKWNVVWPEVRFSSTPQITPLGERIGMLRGEARKVAYQWLEKFSQGQLAPPAPKDFTKWEKLNFSDENLKDRIQQEWKEVLSGKKSAPRTQPAQQGFSPWAQEDGHLRFYFFFSTPLPSQPKGNEPPHLAEIQLIVQSKGTVDLKTVTSPPTWEVMSVEITQSREIPAAALEAKE